MELSGFQDTYQTVEFVKDIQGHSIVTWIVPDRYCSVGQPCSIDHWNSADTDYYRVSMDSGLAVGYTRAQQSYNCKDHARAHPSPASVFPCTERYHVQIHLS